MLASLVLHLHPRVVPERALSFTLTFGLGGMSLVLVLLLVATGVLLLFHYEPSADRAYDSVRALGAEVPFGQFVRNIHRWGANLALVLVFLHLLRVVFTGAFHGVRKGNWIVGLLVLFLVLASNFTGYLLPWDQVSYWAVTISTGMLDYVPLAGAMLQRLLRGGADVGPRTLTTFYVLHIVFLPVAMMCLLALHFWLVRKAGGVVLPRAPGEPPPPRSPLVSTSPHLTRREGVTALVLLAALLAFALLVDAPLEDRANPGLSPNPAKAPWYFMGVQELLVHFHPLFAVLVIPLLLMVLLCRLPYAGYAAPAEGIWFVSAKGRQMARTAAIASLGITAAAVLVDAYLLNFPGWLPGIPVLVTTGLLPFGIVTALVMAGGRWLRKRYEASAEEMTQTVFIALVVAFLTLTVVGVACRGEGMMLAWPWKVAAGAGGMQAGR